MKKAKPPGPPETQIAASPLASANGNFFQPGIVL